MDPKASGNTFGATVFSSYGAFNLTYAGLYLPGKSHISFLFCRHR
jgi:succinate-acetate transporter protein